MFALWKQTAQSPEPTHAQHWSHIVQIIGSAVVQRSLLCWELLTDWLTWLSTISEVQCGKSFFLHKNHKIVLFRRAKLKIMSVFAAIKRNHCLFFCRQPWLFERVTPYQRHYMNGCIISLWHGSFRLFFYSSDSLLIIRHFRSWNRNESLIIKSL